MKILMIASDNNITSGAFNSMVYLSKKLIEKGNDIIIVVPCHGSGNQLLDDNNLKYIIVKSLNWVGSNERKLLTKIKNIIKTIILIYNFIPYFKYRKIIRNENIEIIHLNTSYTYIGMLAAYRSRCKIVWHLREFLEEDQNNKILLRKIGYKVINRADKIICISKSLYQKYERIFDKEKLEIVYNGIDVDKYFYNKEILKEKKLKLLCVGGISEKKGQLDLCEAVCILRTKYFIDAELLLVGPYTNEILDKINRMKQRFHVNCIKLVGAQNNTLPYYRMADLCFMCSTSEAFGRVTIEGMLSGNLLIGKRGAATNEIIENGVSGFLYNDVGDLVNTIIYVNANRRLANQIAKNGQKLAIERFSSDINAENILRVYEKL